MLDAMTPVLVVYSLCTLYMMAILLRWGAGFLELDLYSPRLRWLAMITDPLINKLRSVLPSFGPMDFSPLVALIAVWLLRQVVMMILVPAQQPVMPFQ